MKKYLCAILCTLLMLTAICGQASAATMQDCAYDHYVDLYSKVVVKKEGKDTGYDPSLYRVFYYTNDPNRLTGYIYVTRISDGVDLAAGEAYIKKGKQILLTLDNYGYQSIANALAEWLYEISLEEGFTITNPTVYFKFIIPKKPSKIKVDKKTGELIKKTKLKLTGWVEAQIDGVWIERKFKLLAKGIF